MFLPRSGKDDDVVQIKEARFPVEAVEDAIHEAGEGGGSVAEAERDLVELKELAAAGVEYRFLLVPLLDRDLPVSALEAKSGKPAGPVEGVEEVVDARNGMCVCYRRLVELPEVHAEPQVAVFFLDHDGW